MSVVLDAYALVAYFREEPAADAVQRVLWEERPTSAPCRRPR
ncbi:MAG: hypothetical protein ACKO91_13660 [Acidimicrobiales bacterium]